jgi:hypothetical protein
MANGMFKKKTDIIHHGPRLMPLPNNCQQLDPPYSSLPTSLKMAGGDENFMADRIIF